MNATSTAVQRPDISLALRTRSGQYVCRRFVVEQIAVRNNNNKAGEGVKYRQMETKNRYLCARVNNPRKDVDNAIMLGAAKRLLEGNTKNLVVWKLLFVVIASVPFQGQQKCARLRFGKHYKTVNVLRAKRHRTTTTTAIPIPPVYFDM